MDISYLKVEQLGNNPFNDTPYFLKLFDNYIVDVNGVASHVCIFLTALLKHETLKEWNYGKWLLDSLKSAYTINENVFFLDESDDGVDSNLPINLFGLIRQFLQSMIHDTSINCYLDSCIQYTSRDVILKTARDLNEIIYKISLQSQRLNTASASEASSIRLQQHRLLWCIYWIFFNLTHKSSLKEKFVQVVINDWQHIPALVSGIIYRPPENIFSLFSHLRDLERFGSSTNSNPSSILEIKTRDVPYVFWLWSCVEHFRLQVNDANKYINERIIAHEGRIRRKRIINRVNGKFVISFNSFLRSIRSNHQQNFVEKFFENTLELNSIFFTYVNKICESGLTFPKVEEVVDLDSIKVNAKESEINLSHDSTADFIWLRVLFSLCKSWAENYLSAQKVVDPGDIKRYSTLMQKLICECEEPLARMISILVALEKEASKFCDGSFPLAVTLSIIGNVEAELKPAIAAILKVILEVNNFKTVIDSRSKLIKEKEKKSPKASS